MRTVFFQIQVLMYNYGDSMPEIIANRLVKIVLGLFLLMAIIVIIVSFIKPSAFGILGAIGMTFSNMVATVLG